MNRRTFLITSGAAGMGALVATRASGQSSATTSTERFLWNTGELQFEFSVSEGRLRQHMFLPASVKVSQESLQWSGPEIGLLCTGQDSPDSGMKQSGGSPGLR